MYGEVKRSRSTKYAECTKYIFMYSQKMQDNTTIQGSLINILKMR